MTPLRLVAVLVLAVFAGCAAAPTSPPASASPGAPAAPAAVKLCNGVDLAGWHADVPAADGGAKIATGWPHSSSAP